MLCYSDIRLVSLSVSNYQHFIFGKPVLPVFLCVKINAVQYRSMAKWSH